MKLDRKEIIIIVLSFGVITSSIVNFTFTTITGRSGIHIPIGENEVFRVGTLHGPNDLDPVDCWDRWSVDVLFQVVEGLFSYNLSDPNLTLIPQLALNYTWVNETILEINLRKGVQFHDGTFFDANAAVWNFKRLLYFMNHTGELPQYSHRSKFHRIFELRDGTPIFKNFVKTSDSSIIITLNSPYAPAIHALTFSGCSILSPTYHEAQGHRYAFIDTYDEKIIGTGPYVYDSYIFGKEVKFTCWENYWKEPVMFDEMIFVINDDPFEHNLAILSGEIDYIIGTSYYRDYFDLYNAYPTVSLGESKNPGFGYHYLGFNYNHINITWRKAMAYAFNYQYLFHDYFMDTKIRSYGPISPGFVEMFNPLINQTAPYYNITLAREIIIQGIPEASGRDASNDSHWGLGVNTLISFNYSYNMETEWNQDLLGLLQTWFSDISIEILDGQPDPSSCVFLIYPPPCACYPFQPHCYDYLRLFWRGWAPDYLDPLQMFLDLYSNTSIWNVGMVNNHLLEEMMTNAMNELNDMKRWDLYQNMSHYISNELFLHVFGFHSKQFFVHAADLYNVPYDSIGNFYAYSIKRNLTWSPY
ncbi:MAG: ABC transporter substrate-binding protein [Promethearchaeota archaeon]|jgi:ABC-type transport system substrate-binding protein